MKTNIGLQTAAVLMIALSTSIVGWRDISARPEESQAVEETFEGYRKAIRDTFEIDIKNFRERLAGGMADGTAITDYDLAQLLEGIKWEREHADDTFIALEIAMDHLARISDYYTRLLRLEREAVTDRLLLM